MATLSADGSADTRLELIFEPITPSLEGPKDAYRIQIKEGHELVINQIFSIDYEWEGYIGHSQLKLLATALTKADCLVGKYIDLESGEVRTGGRRAKSENIALIKGPKCFSLVVWGSLIKDRGMINVMVLMDGSAFGASPPHEALYSYVGTTLVCTPHAVSDFGGKLLQECDAAERMRVNLGIPAPDDYV